jgi:hypothetical protein
MLSEPDDETSLRDGWEGGMPGLSIVSMMSCWSFSRLIAHFLMISIFYRRLRYDIFRGAFFK